MECGQELMNADVSQSQEYSCPSSLRAPLTPRDCDLVFMAVAKLKLRLADECIQKFLATERVDDIEKDLKLAASCIQNALALHGSGIEITATTTRSQDSTVSKDSGPFCTALPLPLTTQQREGIEKELRQALSIVRKVRAARQSGIKNAATTTRSLCSTVSKEVYSCPSSMEALSTPKDSGQHSDSDTALER